MSQLENDDDDKEVDQLRVGLDNMAERLYGKQSMV